MKKILLIVSFILLPSLLYHAQVDLEINDGFTVETTGSLSIELSGDVVENGTGYLKGVVTSGSRTGITSFSGLTLGSGMDGSITRICGYGYTKGNGEGTNMLRYYELNNTGSSVSTSMDVTCIIAGSNDESNGMSGPYFLYTYDTDWIGNGDGSTGSTVSASNVSIGVGVTDLVISEGTGVAAKIFLEGPYDETDDDMNLNLTGYIPLTSPYTEDARTVSAIPALAVDWVLAQVRETETGATVESRSAFIKSDGSLIEDDDSDGIGIKSKPGNYFVIVKHRNHLAIMTTAAQIGLTWGIIPSTYNFTTGSAQFYGGSAGAKEVETGVWGMIAGNGTSVDKVIDGNDYGVVYSDFFQTGYKLGDYNMNAVVDGNDYFYVYSNFFKSSQVSN